jgi:hypothetical protein
MVDDREFSRSTAMPEGYSATWHTQRNSSLEVSTTHSKNGSEIMCRAGNAVNHCQSETARLMIAVRPLTPGLLAVSYSRAVAAVQLQWEPPFTHLPEFPILGYQAELEYLRPNHSLLQRHLVLIPGAETNSSVGLNQSELCGSSRVCARLRARNSIGYSHWSDISCTNIEREHSPLPVNATLSVQPDGRTLVSVVFQVPPCFPKAMQSTIVVQEATSPDSELTPDPVPMEEDALLMESYAVAEMVQDVVYSVVVKLGSSSENATSRPVFVTLPPAQATQPDEKGELIVQIMLDYEDCL